MAKTPSINLLESKGKGFLDKFINWALTIGRFIVIITEVIALSAFLYRFSLDRQLVDLHGKIKQEQALVSSLKGNEKTYRNLQERLALASKFIDKGEQTVKIFKEIMALTPKDFIFSDLTVSEDQLAINGSVRRISSLASFIKALRNYPNINTISLDKIENKTSNGTITVGITATFKKEGETR